MEDISDKTSKKFCLNCGHEKHDSILKRTEIDYDGREYEIVVCQYCRPDNKE